MTRHEAYKSMEQGHKVAHRFFSSDEYICILNGRMVTEEGYNFEEGWSIRTGGQWESGWFVYNK